MKVSEQKASEAVSEQLPLPTEPVHRSELRVCVEHSETAAQKLAGAVPGCVGAVGLVYLASARILSGEQALVGLLLLLLPLELTRRVLSFLQARVGAKGATALVTGLAVAEKVKGAGVVALTALALATGLAGCPQNPYRSQPCGNPGAYRCFDNAPQVCSGGVWVPVGDVPCSHVGGVCAVEPDGVAACVTDNHGSLAQ